MRTGLLVSVYKNPLYAGCANGGISETHDEVLLIDPDKDIGPFKQKDDVPTVKIVRRVIMGEQYVHAEPINRPDQGNVGWIAGGCFVYTSDSRYGRAVGHNYPISLHDRQDTAEMYARLTA